MGVDFLEWHPLSIGLKAGFGWALGKSYEQGW